MTELKDCKTQAEVLAWLNGAERRETIFGLMVVFRYCQEKHQGQALTRMAEIAREKALEDAAHVLAGWCSIGEAASVIAEDIRALKTKETT